MKKNIRFLLSFIIFICSAASLFPQNNELVVTFGGSELSLDPHHTYTSSEAQFNTAIYEGLVVYDPLTLAPRPGAAANWNISDDKKTYTFFLRGNARYWDGTRVTAYDFRDSWLKLLNPEEKAEYSFLLDSIEGAKDYRTGKTSTPEKVGIRALSDQELEIRLTSPAAHILKILCHHSFVPIHPSLIDKNDWSQYSSAPGNGPFYIIKQTEEEILLRKNELYWDAKNVNLSGIRVLKSQDYEEHTRLFNEGILHWAPSGVILTEIKDTQAIVSNPLFSSSYFYFFCRKEPWSIPQVRRGLTLLLPWDQIRTEEHQFIPAATLVPEIPSYPEVTGIPAQNTDEGLQLLEEAGFPAGTGLPSIVIKIPGDFESRRISRIMKSAWEELLETDVVIQEFGYPDYYEELQNSEYTLGTMTWIGDFADPLTFLQLWTRDSNLNDAGYSDDTFENLVQLSMEQEGEKRYTTLSEAEEYLLSEAVVLPISHEPAWNTIDLSAIRGWYPNPLDIHPFKFISFAEDTLPPGVVRLLEREKH